MKIIVREHEGRSIHIALPTGLLLNRFTACILPGALEIKGITVTREQAVRIVQAIRECRKRNSNWKLVEIEEENGGYVEITL